MGELLIVWTVRLGLLCFVAALVWWGRVLTRGGRMRCRRATVAGWLWGFGFAFFVGHVVAAFHFHHHWSHTRAIAETAQQTEELMGFAFGGGLYFNYVFIGLWLIDLIWLVFRRPGEKRRWWQWLIVAYLIFIAFNGTVVFKSGWLRWSGLVGTMVIVYALAPPVIAHLRQARTGGE